MATASKPAKFLTLLCRKPAIVRPPGVSRYARIGPVAAEMLVIEASNNLASEVASALQTLGHDVKFLPRTTIEGAAGVEVRRFAHTIAAIYRKPDEVGHRLLFVCDPRGRCIKTLKAGHWEDMTARQAALAIHRAVASWAETLIA